MAGTSNRVLVCGGVGGCVERGWVVVIVVVVFGTLLGPEITGPHSVVVSCPGGHVSWFSCGGFPLQGFSGGVPAAVRCLAVGWGACCFWFSRAGRAPFAPVRGVPFGGVGCAGVMGLLVENCIVDASILKRSNF